MRVRYKDQVLEATLIHLDKNCILIGNMYEAAIVYTVVYSNEEEARNQFRYFCSRDYNDISDCVVVLGAYDFMFKEPSVMLDYDMVEAGYEYFRTLKDNYCG